jgi:hypothetical protein
MGCPSDRLCSNDRVIDYRDHVGTVVEVFSNGQATVDLDGFGTYARSSSALGKGVTCDGHICVGDRVIDSGDNVGTVKEVFDNGRSKVDLDRFGTEIRSTSFLGKGFRCIENVCVNDRAIDNRNKRGTIKELFDNGKSKVYLDGFGTYIRSFYSLGIKLNCNLRDNCTCRN